MIYKVLPNVKEDYKGARRELNDNGEVQAGQGSAVQFSSQNSLVGIPRAG